MNTKNLISSHISKVLLVVVILFGHNYSYSQNQTDAKMGEILNSVSIR